MGGFLHRALIGPCPSGILRGGSERLTSVAAHTQAFASTDPTVLRAAELVRMVGRGPSPTIEVSNGTVTKIEIGGTDFTDEMSRLAGKTRGLLVTEFAFGTNHLSDALLSWDVNSPLNEGIRGIHLAIGDGDTGIHFDFVCPEAAVS